MTYPRLILPFLSQIPRAGPQMVSFLQVRVVFDTAALISAIRSRTGAAAEIVRLAMLGKPTLLLDYKLVCEYRDVALRPPAHCGIRENSGRC
jgi:hypothetical protein